MARRTSGPKKKLRRGLWSPEEDEKLMNHIAKYGHGCWSSVPKLAGTTVALYMYHILFRHLRICQFGSMPQHGYYIFL